MENSSDEFALALQQMQVHLKKVTEEHTERAWLQSGKNTLNEKLRGDKNIRQLAKEVVDFLASYIGAQIGTLYVLENDVYSLQYARAVTGEITQSYNLGEGLIGQAASEKALMILDKTPSKYFKIESSLGEEKPNAIAFLPAVYNGETIAVVELAKFGEFDSDQQRFLSEISESVAIAINSALGKINLENLVSELQWKEQELNNHLSAIDKSNACIEFDLNGTILRANNIFLELLGYSENEVIGKHHSIFVENTYKNSKEYKQFWDMLKKGNFQQNEFKRIRKDGETIWLKGSYNPIIDSQGKPIKVLKIASDITTVKKQQIEISAIMDAIYQSNCAVEFDMNGTILKANRIFLDLLKYGENEVIGEHHRIFVGKEYASSPEYQVFWDNLRKGKYQEGEFKRITKNGDTVWIKGNYNPILDAEGKPYKILKIATDITLAKKQAEELEKQSEELQTQQEELRQMNEELEEQAQNLKQQQEELQMTNEELEEQTQSLEAKNKEMEEAKHDIEQKTKQLEISSRYKSEFLANMSHELRTPLNSLLILSKDLADNKKQNLTQEQVESAEIIYKSGHDLLTLINEVLDLSKIEAGKMVITVDKIWINDLANNLLRDFKHQTEKKGLSFNIKIKEGVPEFIRTDSLRLNQILKNLLSNAVKFTESGTISVEIKTHDENKLAIAISDTGIGIPEEKRAAIFEAFQQADGGTSRKYGGTGLGLSISRELTKLLEGEIELESKVNSGSTFTLVIPLEIKDQHDFGEEQILVTKTPTSFYSGSKELTDKFHSYPGADDDRNQIQQDDNIVLIIEDDLKFAEIMIEQARKKGFKALSAATGESGLALVEKYKPHAIILDLDLPGISGHIVLAELKSNPGIRHIPVHIISGNERSLKPIKEGAVEYLTKPLDKKQLERTFKRIENFVSRKMKNLLIIEDDENSRKAMRKLIGNGDVKCFEAGTGKEALEIYREQYIDCIILDIGLADISGFELIYKLEHEKETTPPIIVYTGRELTKEENNELEKYAESIIIKGIKSEERLLDETALFLHRTVNNLPESQQRIIATLYDKENAFRNKKILLADDDMRNTFALSKILKDRGIEVIKAENGKVAIELLNEHPDIQMVLMDIMMPEMDGYEAMQKIRAMEEFKQLPIIALTAKAMKDDRQKCMDAGANDYISKPVDTERLLSLMRIWMNK